MKRERFTIIPAAKNDGWVVFLDSEPGFIKEIVASFSSSGDLLDWLRKELAPPEAVT